ncbi:MAG: peroxiredoxin-like family protein [Catalinimonas sp.]
MLKPGTQAPDLHLPTVGDTTWRLSATRPVQFHLLVFYRGYHCPLCRTYVHDLDVTQPEFARRGVEVTALSCDGRERAEMARDEWYLPRLRLAYGLKVEEARRWGLFISRGVNDFEPAVFSEPGVFLLRPDRTVYAVFVQSMSSMRPRFNELLPALDAIIDRKLPPRGGA